MVWKVGLAAVAAVLVLVAAPAASAKGPLEVCGASGCAGLAGDAGHWPVRIIGVDPATPTIAAPALAPYFVIRFGDGSGSPRGHPLAYWIPSASVLRLPGQPGLWIATLPSEEALLDEVTAGLRPYAAPARVSVYVEYEAVPRPSGYLRLFTIGTPVAGSPSAGGWLEIWIMGHRSSPWTDGSTTLWISRRGSLLKRDGQVFRIPLSLAKRIRGRLPLTP